MSMWLDGLVSGLGLVSLSTSLVFPKVAEGATGTVGEIVTNLAYPLVDLALAAAAMGAMAAFGGWRNRTWILLVAGFLALATADSFFLVQAADGTYHQASWVDAAYLVGAALIALSALRPAESAQEVQPSKNRSSLIPGSFAALALIVLVIGAVSPQKMSVLGVGLAVGALVAAGARTVLAMQEVVRLSDSHRLALTDTLTGLPNRRAFYELVDSFTAPREAGQAHSAVLIIDLDRFKEINDALGHQVGDLVLRAICGRLAGHVAADGTIARLGGDEMAVFMPNGSIAQAISLSKRLLTALEEPVTVHDLTLHLGASIGITQTSPGADVGRALAEADLAMYRAKAARTGWEVYDDEQDPDAWDRLALVEALRETIAASELTVAFQPILGAMSGTITSMEALVRWTHPAAGPIAPDVFLPLAEQAGLMPALTRTVIDQSLDQAIAVRERGLAIPVAVNLSASDLMDSQVGQYIADALSQRGLPPQALRIEITESLLVKNEGPAGLFLLRLREREIELAVDDYGTGYSSLSYLHDLPVSTLKIDRSFTNRLVLDSRTGTIVASTIDMAHRLNLSVVAEGVETAAQLDWLRTHGCDHVQGYHLGDPMTPGELEAWLSAYARDRAMAEAGPT